MRLIVERGIVLLLFCLGAAVPALAEKADLQQPVQIEADSVHLNDVSKTAVYQGHVVLTQGTMSMRADRIDVKQDAQGMTSGVATGDPVHFRQKLDGRDQFLEADANQVVYDARTQVIKLIGDAHVKQGGDELRGGLITYNMRTQHYQAQGGEGGDGDGRVHAVIRPNQPVPKKP